MKKIGIVFLTALLLTSFTTVFASDLKGKFAITGVGSLGFPFGDFSDENKKSGNLGSSLGDFFDKAGAKMGYGFVIRLEHYFSDNFTLGGSLSYPVFGTKTARLEEDIKTFLYLEYGKWFHVNVDLKQRLLGVGLFGKYHFFPYSQTCPYVKFGTGLCKYSVSGDLEVISKEGGTSLDVNGSFDSRFYLTLGSGIQYKISEGIFLVLEADLYHVFTDEAEGELEIKSSSFQWKENLELDYNTEYLGLYGGICLFLPNPK